MLALLPPLLCLSLPPAAESPAPAAEAPANAFAAALYVNPTLAGAPAGQLAFSSESREGYAGHTLRWRFLQVQYDVGELDGARVSGSAPLTEDVAVQGSLLFFDENDVEGAVFSLGGLYHQPIEELEGDDGPFKEFEVFGAFNLQHASAFGTENGYSVEVGARGIFAEDFEGELALGYVDIFYDSVYARLRGEYELNPNVALTVGTELSDNSIFFFGVRFYPNSQD